MRSPDIATWRLRAKDRHGRSATLTREEAGDYTLRIEPSSQRDEGEVIRNLNIAIIVEAADIIRS
jgi:hypothetical protein